MRRLDAMELRHEPVNDGVTEDTEHTQNSRITWDRIIYGNCYQMRNVSLLRKAKTGTGVKLFDGEIPDYGGNVVENSWEL